MTTSSSTALLATLAFLAAGGGLQAQTATANTAAPSTSQTAQSATTQAVSSPFPKELSWALGEFEGEGEWTSRLPRLLVRGWNALPDHQLTDSEAAALKEKFRDDSLRALDQQRTTLKLALAKKTLAGSLPSTEPAATEKALADLDAKASQALNGQDMPSEVPKTLALHAIWPTGQEDRPWKVFDRHDLVTKAKVLYAVTGTVRSVGGYLDVHIELYSDMEKKVLADWDGTIAPEEAADRMAEASDHFHEILLGRPWAGLSVSSPITGTKISLAGRWHLLPWWTDDLKPGTVDLLVQSPGRPQEPLSVPLEEGRRTLLKLPAGTAVPEKLVLDTEPSGVSLYLDSRYLGPSPQTVDRPLSTTRVRAQAPGWATLTWEVGPTTSSPSRKTLSLPTPLPSIPDAKDRFYFTLAAFSISLTTTAFASAWTGEQVQLTNAYALAGDQTGYNLAYSRYQLVSAGYITGIVLTSGLFVWMMFELGDYLTAAQTNLP